MKHPTIVYFHRLFFTAAAFILVPGLVAWLVQTDPAVSAALGTCGWVGIHMVPENTAGNGMRAQVHNAMNTLAGTVASIIGLLAYATAFIGPFWRAS